MAEVTPVKVLGTLCLIDEGEADWKVIAIAVSDPWAPFLNDVTDLEEKLPGVVSSIREWFRTYKIPDGKPENQFGLEERCMPASYAMGVVEETHQAWQNLVLESGNMVPNDTGSPTSKKAELWYPKLSSAQISQKTVCSFDSN